MLAQGVLYGMSPTDLWALAGGVAVLLVIASIPSLIPAGRMTIKDLMATLRTE